MTLYEAWGKLCAQDTFSSLKNELEKEKESKASSYKLSDLVTACQHLQQPADEEDSVHAMYEMVRQLMDHNGSELEYKSAMCNMNSDACRGLNKKISDVSMLGCM